MPSGRAVALRYDGGDGAPVVVASGMGYMAEKIVEVDRKRSCRERVLRLV